MFVVDDDCDWLADVDEAAASGSADAMDDSSLIIVADAPEKTTCEERKARRLAA